MFSEVEHEKTKGYLRSYMKRFSIKDLKMSKFFTYLILRIQTTSKY